MESPSTRSWLGVGAVLTALPAAGGCFAAALILAAIVDGDAGAVYEQHRWLGAVVAAGAVCAFAAMMGWATLRHGGVPAPVLLMALALGAVPFAVPGGWFVPAAIGAVAASAALAAAGFGHPPESPLRTRHLSVGLAFAAVVLAVGQAVAVSLNGSARRARAEVKAAHADLHTSHRAEPAPSGKAPAAAAPSSAAAESDAAPSGKDPGGAAHSGGPKDGASTNADSTDRTAHPAGPKDGAAGAGVNDEASAPSNAGATDGASAPRNSTNAVPMDRASAPRNSTNAGATDGPSAPADGGSGNGVPSAAGETGPSSPVKPTPSDGAPALAPIPKPSGGVPAPGVAGSPAAFIRLYYSAIEGKRFGAAWEMLGPQVRRAFGGFRPWRAGYSRTLASLPAGIRVTQGDGVATVGLTLRAGDRDACGKTVERRFAVTWRLVRMDAGWRAAAASARKIAGPEPAARCA